MQDWSENSKQLITTKADWSECVSFNYFEKETYTTKTGKESIRLYMKQNKVNAAYLTQFLSDLLPSIIFHRNQLKYFRNIITSFKENFKCLIDIDFSKNLKVPLKYEPQSAHWNLKQVTVHSGILKNKGQKNYHSHLSDNKKHGKGCWILFQLPLF